MNPHSWLVPQIAASAAHRPMVTVSGEDRDSPAGMINSPNLSSSRHTAPAPRGPLEAAGPRLALVP